MFFSSHYFVSDFEAGPASIVQWLGLTDILRAARLRSQIEVSAADGDRRPVGLRGRLDCGIAFQQWRPGFPRLGGVGPGLWRAGRSRRLSVFLLAPYPVAPEKIRILLLSIIFGVPWILMSQLVAENRFRRIGELRRRIRYRPGMARPRRRLAGGRRHCLGADRISGFCRRYYADPRRGSHQSSKRWRRSAAFPGIVTALLGRSSKTPAKATSDDQGSLMAIAMQCRVGGGRPDLRRRPDHRAFDRSRPAAAWRFAWSMQLQMPTLYDVRHDRAGSPSAWVITAVVAFAGLVLRQHQPIFAARAVSQSPDPRLSRRLERQDAIRIGSPASTSTTISACTICGRRSRSDGAGRTLPVPCRQYRAQRRVDQAPGLAGAQGGIVHRQPAALRQRLSGISRQSDDYGEHKAQQAAFRSAPRWRFPARRSARIWAIIPRRRSRCC